MGHRGDARARDPGARGADGAVGVSRETLSIPISAQTYAEAQQGALFDLIGRPIAWKAAWDAKLSDLFASIEPYLPAVSGRVIDIGGGIGAIDVMIARHMRAQGWGSPEIWILDGEAPPIAERHALPFNSIDASRAMLEANGERLAGYLLPADAPMAPGLPATLICSFGAWCFHIPPGVYLGFVRRSLVKGGRLILEVRKDRPEWIDAIEQAFGPRLEIEESRKFVRCVWERDDRP